MSSWLRECLAQERDSRIQAYRAKPDDLQEHYRNERVVIGGGYGHRLVYELIQNGIDAMLEHNHTATPSLQQDRMHIIVKDGYLYAANTGAPLSRDGVRALLSFGNSPKLTKLNAIGRFGLGFKSILKLGGEVDIVTRDAGIMRFDPVLSRAELGREFGSDRALPAMRLAWHLERDAVGDDRVISDLGWAQTVIRAEIREAGAVDALKDHLRDFPGELLIFVNRPVDLMFDMDDGDPIEIKVVRQGDLLRLEREGEQHHWRCFGTVAKITDANARADGTEYHERDEIPVMWAVPVGEHAPRASGTLWAFAPTHTRSHMAGIVNAPWKVNSDRTAVIGGAWTGALFGVAAELIAESLEGVFSTDDPGAVLDSFPRKPERADDVAAPFVEAVWAELVAEDRRVLPNMHGCLCSARSLQVHPVVSGELIDAWAQLANDDTRSGWVHPSCMEGLRGSRLEELQRRIGVAPVSAVDWIHAVAEPSVSVSSAMIRLAAEVAKDLKHNVQSLDWSSIRAHAKIILGSDGELHAAAEVHMSPEDEVTAGLVPVHPELLRDGDVARILREDFKVKALTPEEWREMLDRQHMNALRGAVGGDGVWQSESGRSADFWAFLRKCPRDIVSAWALENMGEIRLRRRDGRWATLHDVWLQELPAIANADTCSRVFLDTQFHAADMRLIDELRVHWEREATHGFVTDDAWIPLGLHEWRDEARQWWVDERRTGVHRSYLEVSGYEIPRALSLLAQTTGDFNADLTASCARHAIDASLQNTVVMKHTSSQSKGNCAVMHPWLFVVQRHGTCMFGDSCVSVAALIDKRESKHLAVWEGWSESEEWIRAVADGLAESARHGTLRATPDQICELWNALAARRIAIDGPESAACIDLWREAAGDGYVPRDIDIGGTSWRKAGAYITTSRERAVLAGRVGLPCLVVPAEAEALWSRKGAQDVSGVLKIEAEPDCRASGLIEEMFPEIALMDDDGSPVVLSAREHAERMYRLVGSVWCRVGQKRVDLPCAVIEQELVIGESLWSGLARDQRLREVLQTLAGAGWLKWSAADAFEILSSESVMMRRTSVCEANSLEERLLRCVGRDTAVLREALGELGMSDDVQELAEHDLAKLVLAQLGPSTLSSTPISAAMTKEGLRPPSRWGGAEAPEFCQSIGFGPEFAQSASRKRSPEEFVTGPFTLQPLHDFQQEVCSEIAALAGRPGTRRRGIIRLPTGGGKTRVTVEAVVQHVLISSHTQPWVLWIAQTDELCEQAVQAFLQVWSCTGQERVRLRIARLWGGLPNPRPPVPDEPLVVIASIQTLAARFGDPKLKWLSTPSAIVIDECHHADAPSYRTVVNWIESCSKQSTVAGGREPLMLGLSATPFRASDDSTESLAKRFDRTIFPRAQEDLDGRLVSMGVLARVHSDRIESSASISRDEERALNDAARSGDGVRIEQLLQRIDDRLAHDGLRNDLIVRRVSEAPEQSVMLFANSVEHARLLAAKLHMRGVSAAAISGETPVTTRRYFLEQFQKGSIRVICNHSVLSTGFDAPRVSLIVISRQVISAVRYLQMVGRGLRGERNGGTATCRVLTVMDNLRTFSGKHAYHYFERYYRDLTDAK
jgi:superfamily II DNA or RNA helicase